ncbi:MAG: PilC/PilY family type IV pilus protein [Methylophilaceae bacterium]
MIVHVKNMIKNKLLQLCSLALIACSVNVSHAAITDIGNAPLVSSTTGEVLPNIMYILDNSGSMNLSFMPDYVTAANKCKTTGTSGLFTANCNYGHPPFMTSEFNGIYYNPATTYSPGVNADGTERISMTSANTAGWTVVPMDAYGVQSAVTERLVPNAGLTEGYDDIVWCNTTTPANRYDLAVCKKNSQYIFPNNTGVQSSSFNQSFAIVGYPFYYTVTASEHCTDKNLTNCIASPLPTVTHPVPAKLTWCTDATYTNCQAKYLETTPTYTFARWSGLTNGTQSTGKIKINADTAGCGAAGQPSCTAPSAMNITDITVDGVRIIATPVPTNLTITNTTSGTERNTLATRIRDAINNFVPGGAADDFIATTTGDEVTITRVTSGPFAGTINVTATSVTRAAVPGNRAVGSITISRAGKQSGATSPAATRCNPATSASCNVTLNISNITVGSPSNTNIISGTVSYTTGSNADSAATQRLMARAIKDNINTTISAPHDYTATCGAGTAGTGVACTTNVITITAVNTGTATHGGFSITPASGGNLTYTTAAVAGGVNDVSAKTYTIPTTITQFAGGTPVVNTFNRVDIVPTTLAYAKAASRTDCAGTTCTYNEEMTNFANWYSYYRTRMQMMKTSTSRAFKTIDTRFRVGFITINSPSTNYLPIARFSNTQKTSWYARLFAANTGGGTPLRSALTTVGRIYAGQGGSVVGNSADPVQYSCQQNFSLLTTDGYWNTDTASTVAGLGGASVGNLDGGLTPRPLFEGPTASSNTLADAAKYYYDTDLRTTALGNCTGGVRENSTTGDVCEDNVFVTATDNNLKQHMTTFTLGLGVDATLSFSSDYKTATSGDFYELTQGSRNWPVPVQNSQLTIDDLWHAAVNAQGTYFSAKSPSQLTSSLTEALQSIKAKVGAGAAAATSTLNPVSGDNFTYVASYTSQKWIGNLESRTVDTEDGKVSEDATWCLENVIADTCAPPSIVEAITSGSSTEYVCKTPGATPATCSAPGVLDGTDCKVEIATACTGTLQSKVTTTTDTRNILMNVSGALGNFSAGNLTATGNNANFENAFLVANLSQGNIDFDEVSTTSAAKRSLMTSSTLVNYLRGSTGYENRASNAGPPDTRIYRAREATLGDLIDSTPIFVGAPKANFSDPGYGTVSTLGSFKQTQSTRAGTVYIGANDGMVHAIDAVSGEERWAFVPTMVLNNMYKLADKNYKDQHNYYVNGDLVANDVCTADCTSAASAVWKTILVGGLNAGGKGYFALDITNPNSPVLLWEFDASDDNDIGFSFGNPVITKKADGTWVVLLTSGYNNLTGSNPGKGFLYVLDASSGAVISKYATGVGDATTPSGLAEINPYVLDAVVNNSAIYVYGGDLQGNMWRFDINSAQSASNPFRVAILRDASGVVQPITTRPELADINGKRVLYVGTGRYLGTSDLADTQQQTIYAISDEGASTLDNPRTSPLMVNQVLVNDAATGTRTVQSPPNPVDFASGRGWYIDLPDTGERQNVPAQLVFGTLLLPSTVPTNTLCSPGGYGWLNFLDYRTGAAVGGTIVASKTNAPIVGINVLYVKGKPVVNIVTADNPTPTFPANQPEFTGGSASGFTNHRVIWRELLDEQ